ncbi:MAG: non-heme iron oxygenase ferredoxin subunit [Planctomycetota bacterium]|nr:non-heme iron oxygenase ferredoxin subunit [Planctomycetota bacterium]
MPKTVKVADVTELQPGEGKTVDVEGVSLALFNVDGTYFAIANTCTHVGGSLGEGALIGKEVTCPLHGAQFDATSGKVLGGPARNDVKSFPVSLEGDDVFIELE